MGTENSSYDEWIEIYNNSPDTISIEGWTLKNADGSLSINLKGDIPPYGFYLLERTDDNSVPSIKADLIYKGTLKNGGEKLELFAGSDNLTDSINCEERWFAGNNETKQTMERNSLGEWADSKEKGGSPKGKNSEPQPTVSPLFKNDGEDSLNGSVKETSAYPSGLILNEILPSPEGEDAKEEWIEIFNRNDFEVDLSGWKISDTTGKTNSYSFPAGTKIKRGGFLVFYRPTTKIILNNDGDGLRLLNPNGDMADEVFYEKTVLSQSYGLLEGKWGWSDILTPGEENERAKTTAGGGSSTTTSQNFGRRDLAAIGENISKTSKPSCPPPLLISFIIAFLSGTIILFVKKLQQNKNLLQYP